MALKAVRTAAPGLVPVSVNEAKQNWRVDHSDDDTVIQGLLEAAAGHIEELLGRALVTQTWRQDFAEFDDELRLDVGNLISVTSITYYDGDGASQTLATTVYTSFTDDTGPYIALKPDQEWPDTAERDDAVRVTWTAGYGATEASVPRKLRQAILLLGGHWYQNRSAVGEGMQELPLSVSALIGSSRRIIV
jgi:uncharacterized phiE125 gp8 family phage protein